MNSLLPQQRAQNKLASCRIIVIEVLETLDIIIILNYIDWVASLNDEGTECWKFICISLRPIRTEYSKISKNTIDRLENKQIDEFSNIAKSK